MKKKAAPVKRCNCGSGKPWRECCSQKPRPLLEQCKEALIIVSCGIHRDRAKNKCWLFGDGAAVHAVEDCLKAFEREDT